MREPVYFIILNYDNMDVIKPLYESMKKYNDYPRHIIFIDNGSTQDGSKEYLKNLHLNDKTNTTFLEVPYNLGITKPLNMGIRYVKKNYPNAKYLGFMGSDMIVTEGWLSPMIDVFNAKKKVGMVSNQLRDPHNTEFIQNDGALKYTDHYEYRMGFPNVNLVCYKEPVQVLYCQTTCCVMAMEVLDEIGLFDENFYIYSEDIDIQIRAKLAGYTLWHTPLSYAYHHTFHTCKRIREGSVAIAEKMRQDGVYFNNKWGKTIFEQFNNYLNPWDNNNEFIKTFNKSDIHERLEF